MAAAQESDPKPGNILGRALFRVDDGGEALAADEMLFDVMKEWRSTYVVETAEDEFYFRIIAVSLVQLEIGRHDVVSARNHLALRAKHCWEEDRVVEVVDVAAGLAKRPERTVRRLEATRQGCDWLIGRWERLGRVAARGDQWDESQVRLAFDLLATPPEFRDPKHLLDPGQTPTQLVDREMDRLRAIRARGLDEIDEHRRELAELALDPLPNAHVARLERSNNAALRRLIWADARLRRRDAAEAIVAPPAPVAPPPPPPPPPPPVEPPPPTEADYRAADRAFWARLVTEGSPEFFDALDRLAAEADAVVPVSATPSIDPRVYLPKRLMPGR